MTITLSQLKIIYFAKRNKFKKGIKIFVISFKEQGIAILCFSKP